MMILALCRFEFEYDAAFHPGAKKAPLTSSPLALVPLPAAAPQLGCLSSTVHVELCKKKRGEDGSRSGTAV